jgi:hypothetical protein
MSWGKGKGLAQGFAAAALTAALAGAAVAGPVIVRSAGPSARAYPVGKQLPDAAQLVLKPGDTLVLLDSRGTRTLTGPGSFAAAGAGARTNTGQIAGRILANTGSSERRGGAVRGAGSAPGEARSPNLWFVDLSKSGTVCVADPAGVRMWRPSGAKAAVAKVAGGGKTETVALPQGVTVADWPAALPVADGAEYTVTLDGMAPAKIKFAAVPAPEGIEDAASRLIARGCKAQLDLLIASTPPSGGEG